MMIHQILKFYFNLITNDDFPLGMDIALHIWFCQIV